MGRSDEDEPIFRDQLFRKRRRNGAWEVVAAPTIFTPIADTHAHLQLLPDPPLSLARAALHHVEFVETIVDVWEDGSETFDQLSDWEFKAAVDIRSLGRHC